MGVSKMLQFLLPILLISGATSYQSPSFFENKISAASPGQIKFAIENKYDQTGPGAKEPEYAYHTYKHLDDALVAYMDDPDTKLPIAEKSRALSRLYETHFKHETDQYVKPINLHTGMPQKTVPLVLKRYNKLSFDRPLTIFPNVDFRGLQANDVGSESLSSGDPYSWYKDQAPKRIPLKPSPEYYFSFDVGKPTGGNGYQTYEDSNGKKRTLYHHSDDRPGYHSSLKQIFTH